MVTNEDDMEKAHKIVLEQMTSELIQYTLSLIQDEEIKVDNIRDFMKGYYVNSFVINLREIHRLNFNSPIDDNIIFQQYIKKITSSEKLEKLLNNLL